jgi:hypothetical protein
LGYKIPTIKYKTEKIVENLISLELHVGLIDLWCNDLIDIYIDPFMYINDIKTKKEIKKKQQLHQQSITFANFKNMLQ